MGAGTNFFSHLIVNRFPSGSSEFKVPKSAGPLSVTQIYPEGVQSHAIFYVSRENTDLI